MVKDDGVGTSTKCSVRHLTVKTPALLHAQGAHPVELLPRCRRARPHREGNAGAFATEDAHTGRETPWDEEPMRHSECSDHLNSAGSAHLVNFDDLCGVLQEMPAADAEDSPNLECYSAGVCALFRGAMWWSALMGRGGPFSPGRRGCSGAGSAPWSSSSAAPGGVGSAVPSRPTLRYGAFIQSIFDFVIIAFSIFMFIKLLNSFKKKEEKKVEEKQPEENIVLLTEIRDLLKEKK